MITLYKYDRITGYWNIERQCSEETAEQWLKVFSDDAPNEYFYLSHRKPKHNPVPKRF